MLPGLSSLLAMIFSSPQVLCSGARGSTGDSDISYDTLVNIRGKIVVLVKYKNLYRVFSTHIWSCKLVEHKDHFKGTERRAVGNTLKVNKITSK